MSIDLLFCQMFLSFIDSAVTMPQDALAATVHYYCTRGTYLKQETHGPNCSPGLLLFLINKESQAEPLFHLFG